MALYQFQCNNINCRHTFESVKPYNTKTAECPKCGSQSTFQLSSSGLSFRFNIYRPEEH
jgi:putative FmdB family regulatory protein